MKAIVTGVAGFVGSHLAEMLVREGHEVTGIDCFLDYYPRKAKEANLVKLHTQDKFRFIESPLQSIDLVQLVKNCDWIFHLAAQAGVRASWGNQFSIYTTNNILATQLLLEASVGANLKAFVYASSSSVYGNATTLPMKEDLPLHPISPYGVSKLAAEQLCDLYFFNHQLPTISLRYFTVYGPRQRPDMAFHRLLRCTLFDEPFHLFGDGNQTRDFTFVEDIVLATRTAATSGKPGQSYNIGGGSRISMLEVLKIVEQVVGRAPRIEYAPDQKGDMKDTYADTSRAKEDLSYQPGTRIADGLAAEYDWLRDVAKLYS